MAIGDSREKIKTYWINLRGLKKEVPEHYFGVKDADLGKEQEEIQAKFVEGYLWRIEFDTETYESDEFDIMKMYIRDWIKGKPEQYILKARFGILVRKMLNVLINCDPVEKIKISLYINKAGYKEVWISQNDASPEFFYSIEEQRSMREEIWNKAKTKIIKNDYSELDNNLMVNVHEILIPRIEKSRNVIEALYDSAPADDVAPSISKQAEDDESDPDHELAVKQETEHIEKQEAETKAEEKKEGPVDPTNEVSDLLEDDGDDLPF